MADVDDFRMDDLPPADAYVATKAPDLKLDSGLPANEHVEKCVLAAILMDNSAYNDAAETLVASDFSLDSHQRIFSRISDLIDAGKQVDELTLTEELRRTKELEAIGGVSYIVSLSEGMPLKPQTGDWIRIIKEKSQLRRLMAICASAIHRAADQSDAAISVLEDTESQLLEIAQNAATGRLRSVAESVEAAGGVDPYLKPIIDSQIEMGLPTGFYDLDRMIGGLHKGELTIVGGRPSQGKSAFGLCVAANAAIDSNAVVAFFSLEMARASLERRLLALIGRVDVRKATTGEFISGRDRDNLQIASGKLVETNLFIDDTPAITPVQMRAKARRLKRRAGRLDLLVCDYLQLMSSGTKTESRQVEVGAISRALKAISKDLDIPVLALAQVARSAENRQDKRPTLADLRESGSIEQDADIVTFVHRDSYYNRDEEMSDEDRALAEIIVAKSREGPTGIVRLLYLAPFTCFCNPAR